MALFLANTTEEQEGEVIASNPPKRRPLLFDLDDQITNFAILPYLYLFDVLRLVCTCKTLIKTIDQPKYFINFFSIKLSLIPRVQEPHRLVHYLIRVGYDLKQAILSMMNVLYSPDTYPATLEMFDVLHHVHDFSSRDRPNESASNLLTKSACYQRF